MAGRDETPGSGAAAPLAGTAAIVTGASAGIGRASALLLARLGADLGLVQRRQGADIASEIALLGRRCEVERADVGDGEAAAAAVDALASRLGRLDGLVANAGTIVRKPALETTLAEFRRVVDVNLTGAFAVAQAAARHMLARQTGGSIVLLASQLSFFGGVRVAAYSASKGGVAQLAKSLSNEWAPLGIRVNAVAPGWVETDMTDALRADPTRYPEISSRIPQGRWGRPEEIAEAIAWLVSPASGYVTGAVVPVDGGYLAR
jgi:2-deoxy-D-gluconate 3-dehydrogenase